MILSCIKPLTNGSSNVLFDLRESLATKKSIDLGELMKLFAKNNILRTH